MTWNNCSSEKPNTRLPLFLPPSRLPVSCHPHGIPASSPLLNSNITFTPLGCKLYQAYAILEIRIKSTYL